MSRPRSPAGTSGRRATPARSSAASSGRRTVTVPQVQSDVYTALLGIALAAIVIGCGLLTFVWSGYDFSTKP